MSNDLLNMKLESANQLEGLNLNSSQKMIEESSISNVAMQTPIDVVDGGVGDKSDKIDALNEQESNQIFDLINQLNTQFNDLNNNTTSSSSSSNGVTTTTMPSQQVQQHLADISNSNGGHQESRMNGAELEKTFIKTSSNGEQAAPVTSSPVANGDGCGSNSSSLDVNQENSHQNNHITNNNKISPLQTKIPRIANNSKPSNATSSIPQLSSLKSQLSGVSAMDQAVSKHPAASSSSSSSSSSIPVSKINHSNKQTTAAAAAAAENTPMSRIARSISKSSGVNSQLSDQQHMAKKSEAKKTTPEIRPLATSTYKRGSSLSTRTGNKAARSMSINPDNEASRETITSNEEPKFNADGTRNVKYVVRHKPRESKVKIFSQKVVPKNVQSKIGSLKNYDHKPAGGDVVIEKNEINWNAKSKIGSLEKANYVPAGGNVKIESKKLNWNAKSKIGSLEKANYVPAGGNVKIETKKLNFKEKARPRTDTGLLVIENDEFNESDESRKLNSSHSSNSVQSQ